MRRSIDSDATSARPGLAPALVIFAVTAALVVVVGRNQWFFGDEWDFIAGRRVGSLDDLLRPHNEHWSTIPIIVWRAMLALFGTASYLPYLAMLALFHWGLAVVVYLLLARHGAPWLVALLGGLVVLAFGPGWENLLWAFQIGFVGSLVAILAAFLLVQSQRDRAAAALLVVAALCSGLGVAGAAGMGLALAMRSQLRRAMLVSGPALLIQALWLVWYREEVLAAHDPDLVASLGMLPRYVVLGLGSSLAGISPFAGREVGVALVVVLLGLLVVRAALSEAPTPVAVPGLLLVAVGIFASAGLSRASVFGVGQAEASRYAHLGAALLLPAVGIAAYSSRWVRERVTARGHAVVTALLVIVVVTNFALLGDEAREFRDLVAVDRTAIEAVARALEDIDPAALATEARPIPRNPQLTTADLVSLLDSGLWRSDPSWPVAGEDLSRATDLLTGLPAAE